jgi:hypothetical protein
LSGDPEFIRLSDEIFREFQKRRKAAEEHHDPRIARIKPADAWGWFIEREETSQTQMEKERRPRNEKRFYEAFKSLEREGLIIQAPASVDEYVLTSNGEKLPQDHIMVRTLEEKYRSLKPRWDDFFLRRRLGYVAFALLLSGLLGVIVTGEWKSPVGNPGALVLSFTQYTPTFLAVSILGILVFMFAMGPQLSKDQLVFARTYRAYDSAKKGRYVDAVKELQRASEILRYFPGWKSRWEIVDKQLKPLFTKIGNCILDRLLPVVASQDAAAVDGILPKILETADSLAHPSPDGLRRAGEALELLDRKKPHKTPGALERLTSRWEPLHLVLKTMGVFMASLAIPTVVFSLVAYTFGKPMFDYDNTIRIAYGFFTCVVGLTVGLIFKRR